MKHLIALGLLFCVAGQLVTANPYYRDGNGDGSPSYPLVVTASDVDGDLNQVVLRMRNSYDTLASTLIAENLSATDTGEATMVINYNNILRGLPGTSYEYFARGVDLMGNLAEVTGTLTVGDRPPSATFISAQFVSSPARIELVAEGRGEDDFDLDHFNLFFRRKEFDELAFGAEWTRIDLSAVHSISATNATVQFDAGANIYRLQANGEVDSIQTAVSYIPPSAGDYQFGFVLNDKPEGAGPLQARIFSPIVRYSQSQKIQLRSVAYPKPGLEAWFETSDMAVEVYDLN